MMSAVDQGQSIPEIYLRTSLFTAIKSLRLKFTIQKLISYFFLVQGRLDASEEYLFWFAILKILYSNANRKENELYEKIYFTRKYKQ